MTEETKKKLMKTLQIAVNAITAILAVWLAVSCTMSLSVSKNNQNSTQKTEQTSTSSVDSTSINLKK